MRMKTKCLILLCLLCSLVFVFSSCSKYDDMGDGNTGGNGDPKIQGEKAIGNDIASRNDSIVSSKAFSIPEDGNTGGDGMPKSN